MSTHAAMRERLHGCRSHDEVMEAVRELCCAFGQILGLTLLCNKENSANGMCVIDFAPHQDAAAICAARLGGRVFGYNSVILSFPRHPEFRCRQGFPPSAPSCSCNPAA